MVDQPNAKTGESRPGQRPWFTWRKAVCVVGLLLVAGYIYGRPTFEKWLGIELPAIVEQDAAGKKDDSGKNPERQTAKSTSPDSSSKNGSKTKSSSGVNDSGKRQTQKSTATDNGGFKRTSLGNGRFETPNGLRFNQNRLEHVMLHAKDSLGKPTHGVFDAKSEDDVLELIDAAYAKAKDTPNSRDVRSKKEDRRMVYTIDMKRKVGFTGGRNASNRGKKPCNHIRIVVENQNVITAFPLRQ